MIIPAIQTSLVIPIYERDGDGGKDEEHGGILSLVIFQGRGRSCALLANVYSTSEDAPRDVGYTGYDWV